MANEFKIKNGLILGPFPSQPVISIQDTSISIVADASSILVTGKAIYDYINSIPSGTLAGLIDVSIIDISSNQFLQYDFETSKWKNVSPLEASSYFWELSTALLREASLGTGLAWNAGMLDVSASGGSGTGLTPIEVSSNYNTLSNYLLLVNTSNNAIDITLPASPINGDIVQIIDVIKNASTNNINILRNGHLIDRTSSNFLIDIDGGSIKLVYHILEDNFALLALETLKGYEEDVSSDATLDLSAVNQDYLPRVGSFINIGASTNRIDAIYANDVYISHSSLWVNDKKVISDESDVITVSTDVNQDLMMKTTGSGDSKVESADGILLNVISGYISKDIELRTDSDAGSIILDANGTDGTLLGFANSNIELTSNAALKLTGHSIEFDSSLDMTTHGNFTIDGCLSINGNIVQNGSSYITHAENVYTTKDFITMRDGALSALLDGSISGIRIVKPNNTNNVILGTDNDAIMRVGWEPGTLVALAGREDAPTNNYYAYWDDSSSIFKTKDLKGYIDGSLATFAKNASLGLYVQKAGDTMTGNLTINASGLIPQAFKVVNTDSGKGMWFRPQNNGVQAFYAEEALQFTSATGAIVFRGGIAPETEFMSLSSTVLKVPGNIAIGTTAPAYNLDVSGNARISGGLLGHLKEASLGSDFAWIGGLLDVSIASSSVSSLNTLTDVSITSIADNQFIQYESSTSLWKNIDSIAIDSILPSFYYVDASYVRKSGDTMTGDLTVNTSVNILGKLGVGGGTSATYALQVTGVSSIYASGIINSAGTIISGYAQHNVIYPTSDSDIGFYTRVLTIKRIIFGGNQGTGNYKWGAWKTASDSSLGWFGIGTIDPSCSLDVSGNFHLTGAATIDGSINIKSAHYADGSIGFTGTFLADGSTVTVKNGIIVQVR